MTIDEYVMSLPSAYYGNQRSIIRSKLARFKKSHSEMLGDEIEQLTGISYDWSDADHGEAPKYQD